MSHSSGSDSEGEGVPTGHRGNAVASKLADVQAAIEGGGLVQQLTAITLLRLTPVVGDVCVTLYYFVCVASCDHVCHV